ncbi:MAG: YihY/virulence factor BrkB family protein [candidate division NC10 bacterium]|nr:YihY/virulence factor BrkB family protein [candidate division NC10 bacterium]MDE2322994.1 YihY/virulence factor BrkB family protein [candidate division NC10 bacterium]
MLSGMATQQSAFRWRPTRFLRELWRCLSRRDPFMMAAAISFYGLLSLIPFLLIGSAILGVFAGSSREATHIITETIRRVLPRATGAQIEGAIQSLIHGRRVAGGLGLLSLLWVASGAFDMVASALTALSNVQESRSYLRRKVTALFLMLICSLGFLVSLAAASLATVIEALGNRLLEVVPAEISVPHGLLLHLLPATLVGATFLLMYRVAPARPIPLRAALLGAVVAGVLWHLARQLFNWYLLTYARYNPVFGILGSAMALLLWLYYSALIFLLGGAIAEALRRTS